MVAAVAASTWASDTEARASSVNVARSSSVSSELVSKSSDVAAGWLTGDWSHCFLTVLRWTANVLAKASMEENSSLL